MKIIVPFPDLGDQMFYVLPWTSLSELTNNMPPKKKLDPLEFSGVAVDEAAVPNKFLTMPQSYSQYIEPKLKSDGMNLNQWISSLNQTLHVVLAVPRFLSDEANLLNLSPSIDRVVRNLLINTIDLDL